MSIAIHSDYEQPEAEPESDEEIERRELRAEIEELKVLGANLLFDLNQVCQAILDEAVRRDWCSDYDEFAAKVNRGLRTGKALQVREVEHEYVVTITVDVPYDCDRSEFQSRLYELASDACDDAGMGEHSISVRETV